MGVCIEWEEVRGWWNVLDFDLGVGCLGVYICEILLSYMFFRVVYFFVSILDFNKIGKKFLVKIVLTFVNFVMLFFRWYSLVFGIRYILSF